MGRITHIENLPASEVSSEDAKIHGHIRISRITLADSARERGRLINPVSIRRRLNFDDVNDVTPLAGPSRETAGDFVHQEDKSSNKWNFDFENENPLPGDWIWVKVGSKSSEIEDVADGSCKDLLPINESQSHD